MTTPELIQYVKSEVARGTTREIISDKLKMQGWSVLDIVEVFNIINNETTKIPQSEKPPTSTLNQDISSLETVSQMAGATNTASLTSSVPQSSFEPVSVHKSRKALRLIVIILVLLVFIAGVALAYGSGYFMQVEKLFSQTLDSSKKNTSVSYDFQMTLDATNMKLPEGVVGIGSEGFETFSFTAKGATDFSDEKNIKLNNTIHFKTGKIEVGVDSRAINNSFYLSLTKAPDLGFFSLAPFENKWIVFTMDDSSKNLSDNPIFALSPMDTSLIDNITEEQKKKITKIFNDASLIKITKKHLPQMMDGSLSYHFDFDLDKEGIASFMKEMATYMESQNKNNGEIVMGEPIDYKEYTSKALSAISNFHGEVWVGIFDKLPHKVTISSDIINPEKPKDGSAQMKLNMLYTDWNKPVVVEVPAKSVTIEELMKETMGGLFGDTSITSDTNKNVTTNVSFSTNDMTLITENTGEKSISILKEMQNRAKLKFESIASYKGFCKDKTLDGAYQLAVQLPNGTIYKCNDSISSWAAWIKLDGENYLCVDKNSLGQLKYLPTGTSCTK